MIGKDRWPNLGKRGKYSFLHLEVEAWGLNFTNQILTWVFIIIESLCPPLSSDTPSDVLPLLLPEMFSGDKEQPSQEAPFSSVGYRCPSRSLMATYMAPFHPSFRLWRFTSDTNHLHLVQKDSVLHKIASPSDSSHKWGLKTTLLTSWIIN